MQRELERASDSSVASRWLCYRGNSPPCWASECSSAKWGFTPGKFSSNPKVFKTSEVEITPLSVALPPRGGEAVLEQVSVSASRCSGMSGRTDH